MARHGQQEADATQGEHGPIQLRIMPIMLNSATQSDTVPTANTSPALDTAMNHDFTDEWIGWKLRGRYLITPDGDRLTPERIRGLGFRDALELRLAGLRSRRDAEKARQRDSVVVRLPKPR